jgi:hypothetical protein
VAVRIARGTILTAEVLDSRGRNPKKRPLVVVEDYADGDVAPVCVAVTSVLPNPLPAEYVRLPWHRDRGSGKTGLTRACAAVCNWLVRVVESQVAEQVGRAPDACLLDIVTRIRASLPPPAGPPP